MARPRERDEVLTEVFKFRLSKRQDEILTYLTKLNHTGKGRFLRMIIDQATQAGSTVRVINQLTKPVLAHEAMLSDLHALVHQVAYLGRKLELYDSSLAAEVLRVKEEVLRTMQWFREYVRNELNY